VVSIIIPVYRDSAALARLLSTTDLQGAEVIVAATSADREVLAPLRASRPDVIWLEAPRGRARQMNVGAAAARGDWLIFLHADTRLPAAWSGVLARAADSPVDLGCFRFALDSRAAAARVIELGVRARVRFFQLPYGDQALFVRRSAFRAVDGYRDLPIMEDVDLVRRLRSRPGTLLMRAPEAAVTSARRWEQDGWVRRTARHLSMILLYFAGMAPERLARMDPGRRPSDAADAT
jgi:rSAM/selenodomain-associated transferase 2